MNVSASGPAPLHAAGFSSTVELDALVELAAKRLMLAVDVAAAIRQGGSPPAERRVLAARVLRLAAERTAGAHPCLVTPEHTRQAREILGPGKLLAPEQRVVLETDPARARAVGRPSVVQPWPSS
jgi:hypothetical protein